jgi:hypothetical protein
MSFELVLHAAGVVQDLFIDQALYFEYLLPLVSLFVFGVVFVGDGHGVHPS